MAKTRSKSAAAATTTAAKASPTAAKVTKSKVTKPSSSPSKTTKNKSVKKTTTKKTTPKQEEEEKEEIVETVTENSSLIPEEITEKAISELKKYITRQSQQEIESKDSKKSKLFDEDEDDEDDKQNESFYLTIDSKKFWSSKPQFKPKSIKLTKPLYENNQNSTSNSNNDIIVDNNICLIIRDELIKSIDELNELDNSQSLSQISQIIPLNSIKTEYKSFEKKRELYHQFKIFLIDEAILNIMPNTLGKVFYSKGSSNDKIPIPIKVTATKTDSESQSNGKQLSIVTLTNQLNKVLNSTYYLPPIGNNITIKIGKIKFDNNDLIANINDVVKSLDLDTIKSIHVKTSTSPAIPLFYTKSLSQ